MRKYNYILSAIVAALGGYVYYLSAQFPTGTIDVLGAAFWPKILCVALMALAVALAVATALGGESSGDTVTFFKTHDQLLVWFIVLAVAGFFGLIKLVGFLAAAAIFLPAAYLILGERGLVKILVIDGGIILFVWVVFCQLLHVQLPTGILF